MLNKKICTVCWLNYYILHNMEYNTEFTMSKIYKKNLIDDINNAFKKGSLYCPTDYEQIIRQNINNKPPQDCPYILEHLMEDKTC